ncbi:37S ribosomal protein RSM18 like [Verticillium longisporum]|uniref:Small ribosomal subunit protein bS18m n=4 Tax=Verticillium TaxID=1036719 RepID=G2WRJ8_VERDV|nr:uncharacterized protein VDAG_00181 [Verticillium dahliae VdLs.17]KAF3344430.1 hypothetical protein VdG2_07529 [Verticillium dahliae VDG2]KAG7142969.1 37S ribosomal protein RSM18 like [Verticillium longisporum]PNH44968.1 hypothetical protein VD0004_g2823 [Verticillium dahliae]EGY13499.1 hypothetical protein VDAG_00181 [Verticillium dahliae VdLs.17]PNH72902.1 hypothetical protein VD0001_g4633 [Verticillium dahliae]
MPPRLSFLPAVTAPSAFLRRLARPLSTTPALSQSKPNSASDILTLDERPAPGNNAERVQNLVRGGKFAQSEAQLARKRFELQQLRERKTSDDYMKQMPRKWKTGDVYAPHDMNPHQLARWKKKTAPKRDVTDLLSLNPLDMYKNFSMISEYMTSFGQIKNSRDTGLRPRNQRRMAKAIRRVIGMGIHPSVHFHPEIIMKRLQGGRKL